MTMWQELRKKYTDYTLEDIGKMVNKNRFEISRYENGHIAMPKNLKIMYLGFRNNKYDKKIIEFLNETK